jgi:seryl-tRNA synthetase
VCLHLFAAAADRRLDTPFVATARQSCGRHEAAASTTRLWSFTMREIVYIGDAAGALAFRDEVLLATQDLAQEIGLPCRLVPAADPFFTRLRGDLTRYQDSFDLKYELVGRMPGEADPVAITSINLHQQHFGKGFAIYSSDGRAAASACIGFGLDRWAHWLNAYLGNDPAGWPPALVNGLRSRERRAFSS